MVLVEYRREENSNEILSYSMKCLTNLLYEPYKQKKEKICKSINISTLIVLSITQTFETTAYKTVFESQRIIYNQQDIIIITKTVAATLMTKKRNKLK